MNPAAKNIVEDGLGKNFWKTYPATASPELTIADAGHRSFLVSVYPTQEGTATFSRDITMEKGAQAALLDTARLLQPAQAAASIAGWDLNIATGEILWTDRL